MNDKLISSLAVAAILGAITSTTFAQASTKDIVLDRVAAPAVSALRPGTPSAANAYSDAMVASVLLESPDGTLKPRGTHKVFSTGDRFRVKVLTSRDARITLFNTKPDGQLVTKPLWQGQAKLGQELVTPRLRLQGQSGVDQLHVVMQPVHEEGIVNWLGNWLARQSKTPKGSPDASGESASKDIVLDVQNTDSASYLLNPRGQGLVTTINIAHH